MKNLITATVVLGSLLAAGTARADDLATANATFDKKDYRTAIQLYKPLAEQGNTSAESVLGSMYFYGHGVEKDAVRAYMWFSLASEGVGAVADVAKTNRAVVGKILKSTELSLAENLARQCLDTKFKRCGEWTS